MSDFPLISISSILSKLRALPFWVVGGLALSGICILFVSTLANNKFSNFIIQWEVWIIFMTIVFSCLTIIYFFQILVIGMIDYSKYRRTTLFHNPLKLFPHDNKCWWHLAKQKDGTFVSQIQFSMDVSNHSSLPMNLVAPRLIRPKLKGDVIYAEVMSKNAGGFSNDNKSKVPPHGIVTFSVIMSVRGQLKLWGKRPQVTVGIIDQFAEEHRFKLLAIRTHDRVSPKRNLILHVINNFKKMLPGRKKTSVDNTSSLLHEWQHRGKFENVDLILNEERRCYAACGRDRGGLGSLNIGLQSEPNYGCTLVGSIPNLLWDKNSAKIIESPNVVRLINLYGTLSVTEKADCEQYLLSHLHKDSPFVEVAYFIFIGLHRMGRTIEALQVARANLPGDKCFGYSNLLGILSAIISHEYFKIDLNLYPKILELLPNNDIEYNFRLKEKINLARLIRIDSQYANDNLNK